MNTATRITTTMIIALAMIGMLSGIGAAIPTTTMDYNVNFNGIGDGLFHIITGTPAGNDLMQVQWTNSAANGHQDASSAGDGWTKINRDATIKGTDGADASGTIYTHSEMLSGDYTPASVTAYAGYSDNVAGGSYVHLEQGTALEDSDATPDSGCDGIGTGVTIYGYAYGDANTSVRGSVSSVTDGTNNASTMVGAYAHDGSLNMKVGSGILDDRGNNEGSGTIYKIRVSDPDSMATGAIWGNALIGGVPQYPEKNNTLYTDISGGSYLGATGNFTALTTGNLGSTCINETFVGMLSVLPPGIVPE